MKICQTASFNPGLCESLIYGYIRKIKELIPKEVIRICCKFICSYVVTLFMQFHSNCNSEEFYYIDVKLKENTKLSYSKPNSIKPYDEFLTHSLCHIPNICFNKRNYNAIIGFCTMHSNYDISDPIDWPVNLILNLIPYNNTKYETFISHETANINRTLLYCDAQNGIISQHVGTSNLTKLYQLKFDNIYLYTSELQGNNIFGFKYCAEKGASFHSNPTYRKRYYLEMSYINTTKCIFCIECSEPNYRCSNMEYDRCKLNVKFGIFDLNNYQWKLVENHPFSSYAPRDYVFGTVCKNHGYETSKMYVILNNTYTSQYDIIKNKWNVLHDEVTGELISLPRVKCVWLNDNPFTIYRSSIQKGDIRCFDIRDNNAKWILVKDVIDILKHLN